MSKLRASSAAVTVKKSQKQIHPNTLEQQQKEESELRDTFGEGLAINKFRENFNPFPSSTELCCVLSIELLLCDYRLSLTSATAQQ